MTTSRSESAVSSSITRALMRIRLGQDRVQRRHDRHAQLAQQREHDGCRPCRRRCRTRAARETTSTALTFRKSAARRYDADVALGDLEADARRIGVPLAGRRSSPARSSRAAEPVAERVAQIGGERGDAALARQVVAEHRNLANGGLGRR